MPVTHIISRFGSSVKRLRYRLGLSQEALAERADLHRTYIAGIERGKRNVTLKSIEKLARALEVSTATLLFHANGSQSRGKSANGESPGERVDILMVEDNRDDVELTLQAFQHARITNSVEVVSDGKAALDYLFCAGRFSRRRMADRPQLVLLDLHLPKIDGLEVLRRMKADERTRTIPVVVLTASRSGSDGRMPSIGRGDVHN